MKAYLDELVIKYNTPEFIENDPVQFPHRYSEKNDIEIVSFLIATIAWGKPEKVLRDADGPDMNPLVASLLGGLEVLKEGSRQPGSRSRGN